VSDVFVEKRGIGNEQQHAPGDERNYRCSITKVIRKVTKVTCLNRSWAYIRSTLNFVVNRMSQQHSGRCEQIPAAASFPTLLGEFAWMGEWVGIVGADRLGLPVKGPYQHSQFRACPHIKTKPLSLLLIYERLCYWRGSSGTRFLQIYNSSWNSLGSQNRGDAARIRIRAEDKI